MNTNSKTRVLSVLAHPDDEVIFGWPVFQNPHIEKSLIVLVSDRDNPQRRWCARRLEPLQQLCDQDGVRLKCLHMDSEFYRLPYRRAEFCINDVYRQVIDAIEQELAAFEPDFVFCHNPLGEYGMFDHRMVFDIVYHHSSATNICITDLCEQHDGWPSYAAIPQSVHELYYEGNPFVTIEPDAEFYCRGKELYERYGCWTWKKLVPPEYPSPACQLFLLKHTATVDGRSESLDVFQTPVRH